MLKKRKQGLRQISVQPHSQKSQGGKRPKSSSTDDHISETWHVHNGVLFSLKKEIPTHVTTWKNLKDITLSEINQPRKGKYCVIPHTGGTRGCHSETEGRGRFPGAGEGKMRSRSLMGTASDWDDENTLEMTVVTVAQCERT